MKSDVVTNPLDKLPDILKRNIGKNLCICNEVLKMDVINVIANGATTVEEVRSLTYATGGNGCCTRQVIRLIECIHSIELEK
ncbi:MAG: (2Fe-2S)-binding protein [Gammaproteobacteria bacterium]|nr:(2Fe-2S)-binding protein [Gammaproteobacteria bacterium]